MGSREWWFVLPVNPVPWTAPEASVGRKNGGTFVNFYSSQELKNYKEAIAAEVEHQLDEDWAPLEDEIALEFFFYRRLDSQERATKRRSRSHIADATNMQKAVEDALQGVLFVNDSQVVDVRSVIVRQDEDADPCVAVRLVWHPDRTLPPEGIQMAISSQPTIEGLEHAKENRRDIPEEIF